VGWDRTLQWAGRLGQEYVCGGWIKAEDHRLSFLASKAGQQKIRAENYGDLRDHLNGADATADVGRVILPATSRGSPRKLKRYYEDAMATVRAFGPPALFITMTANGSAAEVKACLQAWQQSEDRWDLCSEVFDAHRKQLLKELGEGGVFGTSVARFSVLEFQKRGLPHVHVLLWLVDQPSNGEKIDAIVRATIPPVGPLRDSVLRTNVHNCGPGCQGPSGRCKSFFPKPECDATRLKDPNERGDFVLYKRTANVVTVRRDCHDSVFGDVDIVPYSPYLTLRHNSHVNVEIVASSKSPKYLTKYLSKGGSIDRAMVSEKQDEGNEVAQFRSRRVVGAHSALLALRKTPELQLDPPTEALALHLPGQKQVFIQAGSGATSRQTAATNALNRAAARNSQLEAFFLANSLGAEALGVQAVDIPYELFPNYFTWEGASGLWMPRQKAEVKKIGRIRWTHPATGELFYMRRLLMSPQGIGVTSFVELRTVSEEEKPTFKAACVARGLVEGSAEYSDCLREAATTQMPWALRRLYVSILTLGEVEDPVALLQGHWEALTDDWRTSSERARRALLRTELAGLAERAGIELDIGDWGCMMGANGQPLVDVEWPQGEALDPAAVAAVRWQDGGQGLKAASAERACAAKAARPPSAEQLGFIEVVRAAADDGGGCFFLSAGAGTGKTYTLNLLIDELRAGGADVAAMASSGIAAQLLPAPSGTIHSTLKVPIDIGSQEAPMLDVWAANRIAIRRRIWEYDVFVIDEACMSHKNVFTALDATLREIAKPESEGGMGPPVVPGRSHPSWTPFAGKTVVLAGHWAQTLPIVPRGDRAAITYACMFNAQFWGEVSVWSLTENFRLRGAGGAADHARLLHAVAEGTSSDPDSGEFGRLPSGGGVLRLPDRLLIDDGDEARAACKGLTHWVYEGAEGAVLTGGLPGSEAGYDSESYYDFWTSRAILAPHRATVGVYNNQVHPLPLAIPLMPSAPSAPVTHGRTHAGDGPALWRHRGPAVERQGGGRRGGWQGPRYWLGAGRAERRVAVGLATPQAAAGAWRARDGDDEPAPSGSVQWHAVDRAAGAPVEHHWGGRLHHLCHVERWQDDRGRHSARQGRGQGWLPLRLGAAAVPAAAVLRHDDQQVAGPDPVQPSRCRPDQPRVDTRDGLCRPRPRHGSR